jgi:anti-sigma factor ChrR (cupin superfamily)
MKHARHEDMIKGWFVGSFLPTAHSTDACEVALKRYKAGDHEGAHFHKIGTEITLIVTGRVQMAGGEWTDGDIITLEPGEKSEFHALTDALLVVVKTPGATNDKYMVKDNPL